MPRTRIHTLYLDHEKLRLLKAILEEHEKMLRDADFPGQLQELHALQATIDVAEDRGEGCTY